MRRTLRSALILLATCALVLGACGSDDDSGDASGTTTTTESEGGSGGNGSGGDTGTVDPDSDEAEAYCEVARRHNGAPRDQAETIVEEQLEVAPAELEDALQVISENADVIAKGGDWTPEERELVQQPLTQVILYQVDVCDIPFNPYEGGGGG